MYERTYHSKLKQSELPKEKLPFNWKRFVRVSAGVLAVSGIVVLIRLPVLQVKTVEVMGVNVADPEEVSVYVKKEIQGKVLFILPRSSMLVVPTATLAKKLTHAYPRFSSVDVRRKGINTLAVTVREYVGTYLWCNTLDSCYFMTDDGVVYAPSPFFSGDAYAKVFGGEKGDFPFMPITAKDFATVKLLEENLPTVSIHPAEFHFLPNRELRVVFFHNGRESALLFDSEGDTAAALQALDTAFKTDTFANRYRDPERALSYIDLRFPNKIVYKFQ